MMKRLTILGLLGAGMLTLAATSHAHYVQTLSGYAYHSLVCSGVVKQVPNQQQHPGKMTCAFDNALATVYCSTPGNEFTFAGQAAITGTSVTTNLAESGLQSLGGNQYLATATPFQPNLQDFVSACPNGNWTVVAVVLTEFAASITFTDSNNVVASRSVTKCVIPPQFANVIPDPGTQYSCEIINQHLN